jgi:hypothetical protein
VAFAALGGGTVCAIDSSRSSDRAAGGCAGYESITMGKYWINNNSAGTGAGSRRTPDCR